MRSVAYLVMNETHRTMQREIADIQAAESDWMPTQAHCRLGTLIILLLVSLLSGCRTPPDMRPFSRATAQLSGSIKTAGRTVASEVDSITASRNAARDALRADLLKTADQNKQQELTRLAALSTDLIAELSAVEVPLKSETDRLAPINARQAAERDRLTTELALVKLIREGLGDWAADTPNSIS